MFAYLSVHRQTEGRRDGGTDGQTDRHTERRTGGQAGRRNDTPDLSSDTRTVVTHVR